MDGWPARRLEYIIPSISVVGTGIKIVSFVQLVYRMLYLEVDRK